MFSIFIKNARESVGLSQDALAKRLDLTKAAVQNWERGKVKGNYPGYDKLDSLAAALNIPVDILFTEILNRSAVNPLPLGMGI